MSERRSATYVYHATTVERAERIAKTGLMPNYAPEQTSSDIDRRFDRHRPERVVALGVARAAVVYAHADYDRAVRENNRFWLDAKKHELAIVIAEVDPDRAFVCDGYLLDPEYRPEEYWQSMQSLREYVAHPDEPVFAVPDRSNPWRLTRYRYLLPEVLIPDPVPPAQIVDIKIIEGSKLAIDS